MRWTPQSSAFSDKQFMTSTANRQGSQHCVPALVGANPTHMKRLVGVLVHTYGWVLGQDGNLYGPDSSLAWGERVA
jgi:hypothetical protein